MKHVGVALVATALVMTSACAGGGGSGGETIKIAIFPPNSGPFASTGRGITQAAKLAVKDANANGGLDGRKFELVVLETDAAAATTQRLAQRAVQREGAHLLTGIVNSPEVVAVQPRLRALDAVLVSSSARADDILAACDSRTFMTTQVNSEGVAAVTQYLEGLPTKTWSVVGTDTVSGRAGANDFADDMRAKGFSVGEPVFVPSGTTDYGTVIARLKDEGRDGLFSSLFGSDSVAFMKQADQFGLLAGYQTKAGQGFNRDSFWKAMGPPVVGTIGNIGYTTQIKDPSNVAFAKAFRDAYGEDPDYSAGDTYIGVQTLINGVRAAGSDEPEKVAKALSTLEEDTIIGHVSMRPEDHLLLRPEYMGQVEEVSGGYRWNILATLPASQIAPPVSASCS